MTVDWQEVTALATVGVTAILLSRHLFRRRSRISRCGAGCFTCQPPVASPPDNKYVAADIHQDRSTR
jgi:hypothetical protein